MLHHIFDYWTQSIDTLRCHCSNVEVRSVKQHAIRMYRRMAGIILRDMRYQCIFVILTLWFISYVAQNTNQRIGDVSNEWPNKDKKYGISIWDKATWFFRNHCCNYRFFFDFDQVAGFSGASRKTVGHTILIISVKDMIQHLLVVLLKSLRSNAWEDMFSI